MNLVVRQLRVRFRVWITLAIRFLVLLVATAYVGFLIVDRFEDQVSTREGRFVGQWSLSLTKVLMP